MLSRHCSRLRPLGRFVFTITDSVIHVLAVTALNLYFWSANVNFQARTLQLFANQSKLIKLSLTKPNLTQRITDKSTVNSGYGTRRFFTENWQFAT